MGLKTFSKLAEAFEPRKTRQESLTKAKREKIADQQQRATPQRSTHLFTIGLVHQENLAPYLNAGRLPLRASPPGETSQRLVVISNPVHRFLQGGTQVAGFSSHLDFTPFLCAPSTPALARGSAYKRGFLQGNKCEHLCSKSKSPVETHPCTGLWKDLLYLIL